MEANSELEVVKMIRNNYGYVMELKEVRENIFTKLKAKLNCNRLRLSDKEIVLFSNRLAIILTSGIPIVKGLQLLQNSNHNTISKICKELEISIIGGASLTKALKSCNYRFSPLVVSLVAVGEKTGELCTILREISYHYKKTHELKDFLIKNSLYPLMVLTISVMVLLLFVCFILPVLADTYKTLGISINGMMKISLWLDNIISENYEFIIFCIICMCLFFLQSRGKKLLLKILLQIPLVRNLYFTYLEMRFCKTLGLLLNCGINITEAVNDVSSTFKDEAFVRQLWIFNRLLKRGENIGIAVQCMIKFFSPITIEMITIGAVTGDLPKLLNEAADVAEENLKENLNRLKEFLGPVMLVVTAFIVGAVVMSVMSPLFDLIANLPEYV